VPVVNLDPSRQSWLTNALSRSEWRRVAGLAGAVAMLHLAGFGTLLLFVIPRHFHLGHTGVFGLGLGVTAYMLGLRHAFDADHISAIDNTTRNLMADGKRPIGVGFFFSLGHSTIVFGLAFVLALGFRSLGGEVSNGSSPGHGVTSFVGTSISGAFLYVIALVNLVILVGVFKVFRGMRRGDFDQAELERRIRHHNRGGAPVPGGGSRVQRASVLRDPLPADPVRGRHVGCSTRSMARS
jgi:high-affinity nickel-transport protein